MINLNTLYATSMLAEKLATRNVVLNAAEESPLGMLVSASYSPRLDVQDGETSPGIEAEIHEASKMRGPDGLVEHDRVMEEMVDLIKVAVNGNLHISRNVVNPLIREISEDVIETVARATKDLEQPLSIVPVFRHEIWNNPVLLGMLERYKDVPFAEIVPKQTLPELDGDVLMGMLRTGSARFDQEMMEFVNSLNEGAVADVYRRAFSAAQPNGVEELNLLTNTNSGYHNDTLILHVLARRMAEEPVEGARIGLTEYRTFMLSVVSQTGRALNRYIERWARQAKDRTLVLNWPNASPEFLSKSHNIIEVNGDIYNQWLSEGGEPEVLFGAFLSGKVGGYNTLIENKEGYIRRWQREERLLKMKVSLQEQNIKLEALKAAITRYINEADDEDLPAPRETLHAKLREQISDLSPRHLENIYMAVRRVLCRTAFAHTDAEKTLVKIDEMVEKHQGIDIREAALLAEIELVVEWVAMQITCQSA